MVLASWQCRALHEIGREIALHVKLDETQPRLELPEAAANILFVDQDDQLFYRVVDESGTTVLEGRTVVAFDDIVSVALPVLRHRVLVNFQAEADGIDADEIVRRLLDHVPAR